MNNMKKKLVLFASVAIALASCQTTPKEDYSWIKKGLDVASAQLQLTAEEIDGTGKLPRSIRTGYDMDFLCRQLERDPSTFQDSLRPQPTAEQMGKRRLCVVYDWTSGFFPGSLWYAYELTGNDTLKADAIQYTNLLNPVRYYKGTHDLGFMINCSYGNAERLAPNDTIKAVMKETADNLSGRFNDSIGAIRSWDFGSWNFPVIIDNMMNLDLLFTVSKWTGDNKYKDVAIKHAITTMKNHFRPDYTCWHVISYNNDGTVERKQTHQGKNDDSSWSRGQAWAVYGYTSCYRETNDTTFLNFAVNIADMIMERVKTDDAIPYWDYDAPVAEETPRDASAAAVTAAGFIELSTMVPNGKKYLDYAEKILKSLSSDAYLAKVGENQGFILMHSVGSLPNGSEIDTPLNYADYYYLEARIVSGIHTDTIRPYLDGLVKEPGCYPIDSDDSMFVYKGLPSDLSLLALSSNKAILDQVSLAFRNTYMILVLLAACGIILILCSMRITYWPLHRLLTKLVDKPLPGRSYVDQIDAAFTTALSEKKELQKKLDKYRLSMQKSILDSIVSDSSNSKMNGIMDIDQFFSDEPDNMIFVIKISLPRKNFNANEVVEYLENALPDKNSCALLEAGKAHGIFMINYPGIEDNKDEVIRLLLSDYCRETGCTAAVSNGASSPLEIPYLYENALLADKYRQDAAVVSYTEIAPLIPSPSNLAYPYKNLDALALCLKTPDFKQAHELKKSSFPRSTAPLKTELFFPTSLSGVS